MSLSLHVKQVGPKQWAARVTLTSPKMTNWVYGRTKAEALKKLDTILHNKYIKYSEAVNRINMCRIFTYNQIRHLNMDKLEKRMRHV